MLNTEVLQDISYKTSIQDLSFYDHSNPYLLKCLVWVLRIANVEKSKEITTLSVHASVL